MSLYYVCGQDNEFQGLYGMSYDQIFECDENEEEELYEVGRNLSCEVIESYSTIQECLDEKVNDFCMVHYNLDLSTKFLWEFNEEETEIIEAVRAEIYEKDIYYYYIKLDENKLPTLDPYELDDILINMGSEEFLKEYRIEDTKDYKDLIDF